MSLLAACILAPSQPLPSPVPAPREEMPRPARPYRRSVPRPERKPAPPPQTGPNAAAAPPVTTVLATPAPLAAPPRHGELIGLDQQKAARLFGSATEKIEQPPATVWRYKTPGCELDLFFYLDLRSGRMRTLHYAFKGDVGDTAKRQDCLRAIVAARGS